ncbi:MAG TPA: glycoside hydrolase N-terminal domain-containing protein [Candidatus Limnocylindrales bacterium]|nr:glycoside hydrolase N-terminal domain-containing protein [Candidatus Limnocylindrales bacterium]
MKRRDLLKTTVAAAGLMGTVAEGDPQKPSEHAEAPPADNRPAEYLRRVQGDPFLPKPPLHAGYSISPMPLAERIRRKAVPKRGFCSIAPAKAVKDTLISGNGAMNIELTGDPYEERILFHHESLLMPWKRPLEAPNVASIFPRVRQMVLEGKNREAVALAVQHMNESPIKQDTQPHLTVPAFLMQLDFPKASQAKDYLRTVNFESGEIQVVWTDERGDWVRRTFASRPDKVVVQSLTAPAGRSVNVRISLQKSAEWSMRSGMDWGSHNGIDATSPDRAAFTPGNSGSPAQVPAPKGVEANDVHQDCSSQRLTYKCRLDPSVDNSGYAGVVRVVHSGGAARMDGNALVVENASSVMLLTRIEWFADFSDDKVEPVRRALEQLTSDYPALLERHQRLQSEMFDRVAVDFGGASQYGVSTEELLADQRSRPDCSPALLEKLFGMGRHWFILTSGKYPGIAAEINSTIDLQTAGAVQGDLREGMEAYFKWMESLAPDCRANASNIFGFRGASYPVFPDKGIGASFYYSGNTPIGIWPYWISAGGWRMRPFWEHYLATGDLEFLRNRVLPAYKELALFYEDFLTATDKNGNYLFVPSISPENTPGSTDPSGPTLINATMDIAVCREVLTNLLKASEVLGAESGSVPKWRAMLAKMPPYLLEPDGTLKEWAWPTLQEHYTHRHVSHLYGVWPGDEIDPDRTPQLARAADLADRRRTVDALATAVAGETLPAYSRCHRALAGARLKDNVIVDVQLRQLLEQGYVGSGLRCSREPYGPPVPDAQGGLPAILMEMLLYSRPGVIEVLPALPPALVKGSIRGMHARTFARINKLAWDMEARTVELMVTSAKKQDLTLLARYGIEAITAPAGSLAKPLSAGMADVQIRLPENIPVTFHLKLGRHKPLDWLDQVARA